MIFAALHFGIQPNTRTLLLIGAGVVVVILLILIFWFRLERRHHRSIYAGELPTWGGNYRDALAARASKPKRIDTDQDIRDSKE